MAEAAAGPGGQGGGGGVGGSGGGGGEAGPLAPAERHCYNCGATENRKGGWKAGPQGEAECSTCHRYRSKHGGEARPQRLCRRTQRAAAGAGGGGASRGEGATARAGELCALNDFC